MNTYIMRLRDPVTGEWVEIPAIKGDPGNPGSPGEQGVSIVDAAIDANHHLILTLSDGNTIDAGEIQGGGTDFDIHALTTENAIADTDELPFYDLSAEASRKTAWSNIKSKLKGYFDTLYIGASAISDMATKTWVNAQGFITSLAGYATEAWVEAKGYLTEHQSLAAYRTASAQDDIDDAQDTAIAAKYTKPSGGIPSTDLTTAVQTSLGKADSALQEHQSLSAYRTSAAQDVIDNGKVDKVTGKGLSTNDFTTAYKDAVDANTTARHTHSNKSVLDGITSALVSAWSTASTWVTTNGANVLSHLSDTVKHITAAERTAWNGKLDASAVKTDPYDNVYRIGSYDLGAEYDDNGNGIRATYATKTDLNSKQNAINFSRNGDHEIVAIDGVAIAATSDADGNGISATYATKTELIGKVSTTGDGSNVTATFTQASTRANIATGEKLSVLFGKIAKWFADLKTVAFTGSYTDLSDKPSIPAAQVNADWNSTSGVSQILNKPTIPEIPETVEATSLSIDTTVTSGSSNLITSGAVYTVVGNIESALEALL